MDKNNRLPTNRNFGLVFFFIFLFIAFWPIINGNDVRQWSLVASLIFLLLGLINSRLLSPLNKYWYKFGILLGNFVAPIVMGIIFFLIVTPISIIMRIIGKDIIKLKKNKNNTYWIKKEKNNSSMKNQF